MKLAGSGRIDPKTYVSFSVTNVGKADTTITNVGYYVFETMWDRIRNKSKVAYIVVTGPPGQSVPYVLEPGKNFMTLSFQTDDQVELSKKLLYGSISHSMGKEILVRIRPIENKAPVDAV